MSHNLTLTNVKITDLSVLEAAVNAVSNGKARFVKDQKKFRTWAGQPNKCNHAIVLSEGRHDIGVLQQPDGSFSLVFDPDGMSRSLSVQDYRPDYATDYQDGRYAGIAVGALLQEYILQEAEIKAGMQGYSTNRIKGKNGSVALEIMAA